MHKLFVIFSRFYGVEIPGRMRKVQVKSEGTERRYEEKYVLWLPGTGHCKALPAIGGELHKIQVCAEADSLLCCSSNRAIQPSRPT